MNQFTQIKKMGPIKDLMKMIPGIGGKINLDEIDVDDNATKHIEAIDSCQIKLLPKEQNT